MVRVAGLKTSRRPARASALAGRPDPVRAATRIRERAQVLARSARRHVPRAGTAARRRGLRVLRWTELASRQARVLQAVFSTRIFPVLTPLAVDPGHPFPYISNLWLNLAVLVQRPGARRHPFRAGQGAAASPRFVVCRRAGHGFVPLEDVIAANLAICSPACASLERHVFRVTRNADLEMDDDGAEDLLEALEEELRRRVRAPRCAWRSRRRCPSRCATCWRASWRSTPADVYTSPGPLDLVDCGALDLDRPDLKDPPVPVTRRRWSHRRGATSSPRSRAATCWCTTRTSRSRQWSSASSSRRPTTRTCWPSSRRCTGPPAKPDREALIEAAEAGKQVVVAGGDQGPLRRGAQHRLGRERWRRPACTSSTGSSGLKTHSKLCLVVRREEDGGIRRYVHVGTGNYNPHTARIYEDLGLLTADPRLGADVSAPVQLPDRLRPPSGVRAPHRRATDAANADDRADPPRSGAQHAEHPGYIGMK